MPRPPAREDVAALLLRRIARNAGAASRTATAELRCLLFGEPDVLLFGGEARGGLRCWRAARDGGLESEADFPNAPARGVLNLAPWRDSVASCGEDGGVALWDAVRGLSIAHRVFSHTSAAVSCAVDFDGSVASVGLDQRLALWHPEQQASLTARAPPTAARLVSVAATATLHQLLVCSTAASFIVDMRMCRSGADAALPDLVVHTYTAPRAAADPVNVASAFDKDLGMYRRPFNGEFVLWCAWLNGAPAQPQATM